MQQEESEQVTAQPRQGVVAMLDALGVKGILARSNPADVMGAWAGVVKEFEHSARDVLEISGGACTGCRVIAFSDTVIVTMEGEHPDVLLLHMGDLLGQPFYVALTKEIYFRGVVTIGDFYQSETMVIGRAIDEAADWYEQADWIGVSASPSAAMILDKLYRSRPEDVLDRFVPHYVPMRSGTKEPGWALAWPRIVLDQAELSRAAGRRDEDPETIILEFFAKAPITVPVAPKYRHALAFFDRFMTGTARESLIEELKGDALHWHPGLEESSENAFPAGSE